VSGDGRRDPAVRTAAFQPEAEPPPMNGHNIGAARALLGVAPDDTPPPVRARLHGRGAGAYAVGALLALAAAAGLPLGALLAIGGDAGAALGAGGSTVRAGLTLGLLAAAGVCLPLAALVGRNPRRDAAVLGAGFMCGVALFAAALASSPGGLMGLVLITVAATAAVHVVSPPLLVDLFTPDVRGRLMSWHWAAQLGGVGLGGLLAGLLVGAGLTWRGVLVVVAAVCIALVAVAGKLRDRGFGGGGCRGRRSDVRPGRRR
jgi:MFS family permease